LAIRVSDLYRHPVKSLGGEPLSELDVRISGPVGDRYWAVLDGETGRIRNAKRWPKLLLLTACFVEPPQPDAYDDDVTHVEMRAPDGSRCRSDDADRDAWLSYQLGRPARLAARRPAFCREHYRLGGPRTADEIAADIDLQPGEAFPDYQLSESNFLAQLVEHETPPGSYADAYPIHLVSRNTLRSLERRSGLDAAAPRFRPNIVVDIDSNDIEAVTGGDAPEQAWIGRRLRIGPLVLSLISPTTRCSMPARPQPLLGVAPEPALTRAMVQLCNRTVGLNALIETPGTVRNGDEVQIL
jgi:uncharacterized protein YcbX